MTLNPDAKIKARFFDRGAAVANIEAFGADESALDNTGAFNDARTSLGANGGVILVPPRKYVFDSPIFWNDRPLIIVGSAPGWGVCSEFKFNAGMPGIEVNNGTSALGSRSGIRGLRIIGSEPVNASNPSLTPNNGNHGLEIRAVGFKLEDVDVWNFGGHGVWIRSDNDLGTAVTEFNSNLCYARGVHSYNNRGSGWYVTGPDSNACCFIGLDCGGNGEWGIYEAGEAGNTYIAPHVDWNGGGGYRFGGTGGNNRVFGGYQEGLDVGQLHVWIQGNGLNWLDFTSVSVADIQDDGTNPSIVIAPNGGNSVKSWRVWANPLDANTPRITMIPTQLALDRSKITLGYPGVAWNVEVNTSTQALSIGNGQSKNLDIVAPETRYQGDVILQSAGNGLKIAGGTNATIGTATLVSGTVTVSTTAAKTGSLVLMSVKSPSNPGFLSYSVTDGTSFTILSSNGSDASSVWWMIVNIL